MNNKSKSNKKLNIITILVLILVIIILASISIMYGHNKKIPPNPPETIGNTSGNLNNMGYFCEYDGLIYYANCYDDYHLYELDPMSLTTRVIADVPVAYINAAGDYLYFYYDDQGSEKFMGVAGNTRGIYRIKRNGKDSLNCLDRATSGIISLLGNKIYYQHYDNTDGMTLYSVSIDGRDKIQESASIVNPSCILNGEIYYPDQNNMFYLNVFHPETSSEELYIPARMYNPVASGDYIFYINVDDNYCLYRYDFYTQTTAKLTSERVDTFNVYDNNIFYQTNSQKNPCLMRMYTDGSNPEVIANGIYTDINCTSTYTFFRGFDDKNLFYMVPTQYNASVSEFRPYIE